MKPVTPTGADAEVPEGMRALVERVADRVWERYRTGDRARTRYPTSLRKILNGLGGECATAVLLGLPWNEGDERKADVGERIEVRNSKAAGAPLELRDDDRAKPHSPFVLAIGEYPAYRLVGWLVGDAGCRPGYWHAEGEMHPFFVGTRLDWGRFIVPQAELSPMAELVELVERAKASRP